MATRTPGGSPSFPNGQAREQFGRDWGNYASATTLPNASGNILTTAQFKLEAGDRAYLAVSGTSGIEYLCVSAGTAGGGNAVWIVNSGGLGPWSSVLYVDNVRGNDATGTRGDDNLPFATIQAALNAMQTDDTVLLAPQIFTLTAPLTIPAAVVRGATYGAVPGSSNRTGASQGHAAGQTTLALANAGIASYWNLSANLGLAKWAIGDIYMGFTQSVFNSPTVAVIAGDGSAYAAGTFLNGGGLLLDHCVIFDAAPVSVSLKYVRYFEATGASIVQSISLTNFGSAILSDGAVVQSSTATAVVLAIDFTDPLQPNNGFGLQMIRASIIGFVVLTGQASILADYASLIGGLKGSGMSVSGAHAPALVVGGNVGGIPASSIDFASAGAELPDTATTLVVSFSGARLFAVSQSANNVYGPSNIKFKVGGAAGNFQTVKLDSSAAALPGVTFTADAKIHLTMRGAVAPQAVYTTPGADGDIIPSQFTTGPTALASIAQAVSFGFRMFGTTYMVAPDLDDSTAVYQSVSPRTTTGFTVNVAVASGNFRGLVTYMG